MPQWAYVLAALATVSMLLALAMPVPAGTSLALAVVAMAMFVVVAIPPLAKMFRRRDPYSLASLREVHERSEWAEVDEIEVDPHADVVCPNCGTVRGAVLPVCPNCKRAGGCC